MSKSGNRGSSNRCPNPFSKLQLAQNNVYNSMAAKAEAERLRDENDFLRNRVAQLEAREERWMAEIKRLANKFQ